MLDYFVYLVKYYECEDQWSLYLVRRAIVIFLTEHTSICGCDAGNIIKTGWATHCLKDTCPRSEIYEILIDLVEEGDKMET